MLIVSQLVSASLHHKLNPQITSTVVNHLRHPTSEEGRLYPSPLEQTNAVAVVNMENLTFLTIGMPNKGSVGEHSVHIQNQQFDPSCPSSNLFLAPQKLHLWISSRTEAQRLKRFGICDVGCEIQ
jgi:hypothetical protein